MTGVNTATDTAFGQEVIRFRGYGVSLRGNRKQDERLLFFYFFYGLHAFI